MKSSATGRPSGSVFTLQPEHTDLSSKVTKEKFIFLNPEYMFNEWAIVDYCKVVNFSARQEQFTFQWDDNDDVSFVLKIGFLKC